MYPGTRPGREGGERQRHGEGGAEGCERIGNLVRPERPGLTFPGEDPLHLSAPGTVGQAGSPPTSRDCSAPGVCPALWAVVETGKWWWGGGEPTAKRCGLVPAQWKHGELPPRRRRGLDDCRTHSTRSEPAAGDPAAGLGQRGVGCGSPGEGRAASQERPGRSLRGRVASPDTEEKGIPGTCTGACAQEGKKHAKAWLTCQLPAQERPPTGGTTSWALRSSTTQCTAARDSDGPGLLAVWPGALPL